MRTRDVSTPKSDPRFVNALKGLDANALIYQTLLLTGLRKNELASLTVGQLRLDSPATIDLHAADEKNRQGSTIPLRDDLAAELRDWLADKLADVRREALRRGEPVPSFLASDSPLFDVPNALIKILRHDMRLARIAKQDDRGRVVDVHAMRMTFGTRWQGGSPFADRAGTHAAFRPEVDGERVYRPSIARRGGSDRPFTGVAPNRPAKRSRKRGVRLENRDLRCANRCTNRCTKPCRTGSIRVILYPFEQNRARIGRTSWV